MSRLALPNPTGSVFVLTDELIDLGLAESRKSPRGRMLLPIHREQDALVQRMVNFLQPGSYVQPHIHPREWASETIQVMSGRLGFVVFEESGEVQSVHDLRKGDVIDIEARVWHGVLALEEDTVILELKRGPYCAEDKEFADWAPAENEPGSERFQKKLEALFE